MKQNHVLPFVTVTLLTVPLVSCQSYEKGVEIICNAPNTCGAECENAAPDMRAVKLADYIDGQLSNGEARAMFDNLAAAAPADKKVILDDEAKKAGLANCPLADLVGAPAPKASP